MFLKPFRVKSNSQIKGSDRKKLRAELVAAFPALSADDCLALIPAREEVSLSRLVTRSGDVITCYLCGRQPVLLQLDARLLPTVYTLWQHPDLLPAFTTDAEVVPRLRAGADLMLPGVICDRTRGRRAYPPLQKGQPVAVNTSANRAPVAVGWAARDSDDLYMAAGRGKAVLLVQVLGDLLWEMGSRQPPPELGPPQDLPGQQDTTSWQDGEAEEGGMREVGDAAATAADPATLDIQALSVQESGDVASAPSDITAANDDVTEEPPVSMDDMLYDAFRQAWRTSARRLELPVLVSNFYALHMQPNSPRQLDVKKSSYKKMSKFLEKMESEGLVRTEELVKGVQSIVAVTLDHPEIRDYRVQRISRQEEPAQQESKTQEKGGVRSRVLERVEELYVVSGNVAGIFRELKVAKGTPMAAQQVRKYLTQYVKQKQLQDQADKGCVSLDPVLAGCLTQRAEGFVSALRWDELHQRCLQRMSPAHQLVFAGEPARFAKGAVPCVELTTATRSGNKKVTMVVNLVPFGIDPAEFAHRCQVGVAASTSVGDAPHRPPGTTQVLVQGNQVRFIGRLLQDEYKVPKKYVKGLEKAPKK